MTLRGSLGWIMFGAGWALALCGIIQELCCAGGARILSLLIYLVMGWLAVLLSGHWSMRSAVPALPGWRPGLLFYTGGIVFYATGHKLRHGHGIWHLAVLAGSICHYIAILLHDA